MVVKLTWADIEKHRAVATPAQWRRIEAIFRDGKPIGQVAKEDGQLTGEAAKSRITVITSIGRGCMAVLNSMMERPVRVVRPHVLSGPAHTAGEDVEQPADPPEQTAGGESTHQAELPPRKKRKKNKNRGWILAKGPPKRLAGSGAEASTPPMGSSSASGIAGQATSEDSGHEQSSRTSGEPEGAMALALREALKTQAKSSQA
jgi:hypothetical protein